MSSSSARLQFVSGADELSFGARLAEVAARKHIADITIAMTGAGRRLFFAVGPDGRCLDRSVAQATLNPVGCLVKPLTAMLVAEAVAQTRLGWHDEVAAILGSRDVIGTRLTGVTVQQLLNHTHGLDASSIKSVPRTEDGCIDAAALCEALGARPLSVPGDLYSYSDAGGWLAGAVLEKLYRKPYLHILSARPFMRASRALAVPEGQVCASTGGALRLSAAQWLEFLDTHAEQISALGAERISLPGWGLFEQGACSGWKAYADGWLGHNSNQPDCSAVLRFHPRERVGIFVYAAGDAAAMLALAGVLGDAFPELLHFRIPRPLAQRNLSPLKSDRYTGHFSRCDTRLAVQVGDGAPLSVSVHDPQAGPVWSCPHLRPGKDELFVPEPQDDPRFPFMQFLRPDASNRFEYVWNGRQLWRREEPGNRRLTMARQESMSAVRALIREANADGVSLWVADNRLHYKATRGELSESWRSRLQSNRDDVIGELSRPVIRKRSRTVSVLRLPPLWRDFWLEVQTNLTLAHETHAILNLHGTLSPEGIAAAFETLFNRHDLLRARMELQDDAPCIVFDQIPKSPVTMVDASGEVDRVIQKAIWDPLENGSVFRACVLRLSARDFVVVFVLHHFVCDFASCRLLARELVAVLSGAGLSPAKPIQYYDHMSAWIEWLAGPGPAYRLAYWREQMHAAQRTSLPLNETDAGSGRLETLPFHIDRQLREHIAKFSAACAVTIAEVVLASKIAALSEVTRRTDLVVVVVIGGREDPMLLPLLGNTIGCVPVRVTVTSQMGVRELLQQVHASFSLAQHYRVPWSLLMRTLEEEGIPCAAPIFNFIRGSHDGEAPPASFIQTDSTEVGDMRVERPVEITSVDWKTHQLDVFDSGHELFGTLKYDSTRYRRESALALRAALLDILVREVAAEA